jgi:hypothetical protein
MRDWLLPLSPVIAISYFMLFPQHFNAVLDWAGQLVR